MSPILGGGFTYVAPTTVLAIIPGSGATVGGDVVTIIGTEFRYGATVTIGGNAATSVEVLDSNFLTCVTPAHAAATVNVVVTNLSGLNGTGTLVNGFTYFVAAPTVTAVKPNEGFTVGGESVIITGTGFNAAATVKFAANSATNVVVIDPNHISCTVPAHAAGMVNVDVTNPDTQFGTLFDGYTYDAVDPFLDTKGWWFSDENFAGGSSLALLSASGVGVPKHPRTWSKIIAFATGNGSMLGGSPAASVIYRNKIIYAGDDYTLGTEQPTIRIFDGGSDRLMQRIPTTSAAAIPKAIMAMFLYNGIIYLSTLDSGTTSADFAGRVFTFDPLSQALTPLGAGFSGGEVPYCFAWHKGRLWLGTNKGNGTAGKIYFFRPNIDTAWTQDHSLATDTVGGACSLMSFNGKLYVGTDNSAGNFAKVLVRADDGTYTTSDTGTGGVARVNNGFLQLIIFNTNLYATYWNQDTPAIAKVRKFDGSSWSTAYTGSALTLRPYMLAFIANKYLYVVGGGTGFRASLIRSFTGTSWDELTAYLAGVTTETAQPLFGTIG